MALFANARQLSLDEARIRASQFFHSHSTIQSRAIEPYEPQCVFVGSIENIPKFYVFNRDKNKLGFVVISAEDEMPEILGYSNSSFDFDSIPPALSWWLEQCKTVGVSNFLTENKVSIPPLIKTKWGQDEPYNQLIPSFGANYKPFPTGCTATALSQIMKYWQYPTKGIGYNSYSISYNGVGTLNFMADFGSTTYDWGNMLNTYEKSSYNQTQASAVATLMYHVGVAENTNYSSGSSSASSLNGLQALVNNFGYDRSIQKASRDYYSDDEWSNLLYSELSKGQPIYYSADKIEEGNRSGHAFIIHGYDAESDLFAINWGWDGYCDGYFAMVGYNPLNPYQSNILKSKICNGITGIGSQEIAYTDETADIYNDNDCERTPNLIYKVYDSAKQYEMLGVCADGISKVKIVLQDGSFLPESKCGYTYNWTIDNGIGNLSNNDNPREVEYTAPQNFPGKNNESVCTVNLKIHYTNGEHEGNYDIPIQISRVPLVLVHGLNDNLTTWFTFRDFLISKGSYSKRQIWLVDYSNTNCSHFSVNRLVVTNGIKVAIDNMLHEKFVANKCDVIGHSMGGILTRLHIQYNNGCANINKFITVNTPHSGSPLGDFAGDKPDLVKKFGFSSTDAINDLALNSDQIDNYLNSPSTIGKLRGIPVHAIETEYTGGINALYGSPIYAITALCVNSGIDLFYSGANDGVVSVTSQRGGCSQYSHFRGVNHVLSHKSSAVMTQLYSLLLEDKESTSFSVSGFQPEDLKWSFGNKINETKVNNLSKSVSNRVIIENNNNNLDIVITNGELCSSCISIVSFSDDNLIAFDTPNFTCPIPPTFKGEVNVVVFLSKGDTGFEYLTDSIEIENSKVSLNSISYEDSVIDNIYIGETIELKTKCIWSDGSISIERPDSIIDKNTNIIYKNGLIQLNHEGENIYILNYRGYTCEALINVNPLKQMNEVNPDDEFHGNNLNEPGYNSGQTIYFGIKPDAGGNFVTQIVSKDGILMRNQNGSTINNISINRNYSGDENLTFYFSPMNDGLNTARFDYGVAMINVINGLEYYKKGGSTDNLNSKQLDPGHYYANPVSTTSNTNILPYNGIYAVYPAFSCDGGNTWTKMRFNTSIVIPYIEISGSESPVKISLPINIVQNEIQVGKSTHFEYGEYYTGDIFFTSYNNDIVDVAYDGTITAKKIGATTIKVEIKGDDNYLSEEKLFDINVVEHKISPLVLTIPINKLKVGETTSISIPKDYEGNISYSVYPTGILRVISDGTIETFAPGKATIYATSSSTDDYYETISAFSLDIIEDELDMPNELSISNNPIIGIDNVISEENSTLSVTVCNNTSEKITDATLYYRIYLDGGRYWNRYTWADLSAGASFTHKYDLFNLKDYMTPGKEYTCYFFKDPDYSIPMNISSINFTYGETTEVELNIEESKFVTLSLPFDVNVPSQIKAYSFKAIYNNIMVLTETNFLNKHHSYILSGATGKYLFKGINYPVSNNPQYGFMTGLHKDLVIPSGNYYIDSNGLNFVKSKSDITSIPWSAYATLPNSTSDIIPIVNSENSSLIDIIMPKSNAEIVGIYTIGGIRITHLNKGINIIRYSDGTCLKV